MICTGVTMPLRIMESCTIVHIVWITLLLQQDGDLFPARIPGVKMAIHAVDTDAIDTILFNCTSMELRF